MVWSGRSWLVIWWRRPTTWSEWLAWQPLPQQRDWLAVERPACVLVRLQLRSSAARLTDLALARLSRSLTNQPFFRSLLELTVRTDNQLARRLYERKGFAIEGVRRASLRIGKQAIEEFAMALILDPQVADSGVGDLHVRR